MSCDCIKNTEEALKPHGIELDLPVLINKDSSQAADRVIVQTRKLGDFYRRKKSPVTLFATFCPFCGEKYQEKK